MACDRCQQLESEIQEFRRRDWIIQEVDRVKTELLELDPRVQFKKLISDVKYQRELEDIFGVPFKKIRSHYYWLLSQRNAICHSTQNRYNRVFRFR